MEFGATRFLLRNKIPTRCPLYLFCFYNICHSELVEESKNKKGCRYHRGYVEVLSSNQRWKESEGFNLNSRR